jgi:uncharacterized protein YlzI (FlbEa/FlbD family)
MIRLFRQDGLEFMLNIDLIKEITDDPVTVITLLSGEKIQVKNSLTDVLTKIKACRMGKEDEDRGMEDDPSEQRYKKNRP